MTQTPRKAWLSIGPHSSEWHTDLDLLRRLRSREWDLLLRGLLDLLRLREWDLRRERLLERLCRERDLDLRRRDLDRERECLRFSSFLSVRVNGNNGFGIRGVYERSGKPTCEYRRGQEKASRRPVLTSWFDGCRDEGLSLPDPLHGLLDLLVGGIGLHGLVHVHSGSHVVQPAESIHYVIHSLSMEMCGELKNAGRTGRLQGTYFGSMDCISFRKSAEIA